MKLSKIERALLTLLRAGIWMEEPDDKEVFPLKNEEWKRVYKMAKEQTVSGPVFQGICLLDENLMPPLDLIQIWLAHVDQIEQTNLQMNEKQERLLDELSYKHIHPIVMKGQGVARMYEHPLQRTCGDIDLYFPQEKDFDLIQKWAGEKGNSMELMSDGAWEFLWEGIEVELHPRLIDIHNPFKQKMISKLLSVKGWEDVYPTPLINLLLLNAHILKHVQGHGIGLRQLADYARACYTLDGMYNKEGYRSVCKSLNIYKWSKELNSIMVQVLGLPKDRLPFDEYTNNSTDYIMGKVLRGGNFGKFGKTRSNENGPQWKKKGQTAWTLLKNWGHSFRLAPTESIWFILLLAVGQIKK